MKEKCLFARLRHALFCSFDTMLDMPTMERVVRLFSCLVAILFISCGQRQSYGIFINTDSGIESSDQNELGHRRDSSIDTVQVFFIRAADGEIMDFAEFPADQRVRWPLSFEVEFPDGADSLLMEVRGFRLDLAEPRLSRPAKRIRGSDAPGEVRWHAALRALTVDRLVELPRPPAASPRRNVEIRLSLACMGRAPDLRSRQTCVDASQLSAPLSAGMQEVPLSQLPLRDTAPPVLIGMSPIVEDIPCHGKVPAGARCIPGGMMILGHPDAQYFEEDPLLDATCAFPVTVKPFFLDETEFTIGRLRGLLASGAALSLPIPKGDPDRRWPERFTEYCTWDANAPDNLPVNCFTWADARAACLLAGGDLPTEAQWEFAARGRGRGWRYPWNTVSPECCSTSLSRKDALNSTSQQCPGEGVMPVQSFRNKQCPAGVDVTPEGISDLGGNVSEYVLDTLDSYADVLTREDPGCKSASCRCFWRTAGIVPDRRIGHIDGITAHAGRGGAWGSGLGRASSIYRGVSIERDPQYGFRCAYPDL